MTRICTPNKGIMQRLLAWLLTIATVLALVPVSLPASAASYLDPYLEKMVEWGFLRGDIDGNLRAESNITRAEFVTIINRAFGYTKTGAMPFTDVKDKDWYAEDVAIAYNVGYIQGTSKTTFSPQREITREEASVILARNMMLQAATGENTDFTDSRDISTWSRGLITALVDYEIINGYSDGTFRPQDPITRGETAILVVRAIGTPVQTAGVHSLGNVYGNVAITTSGVTLRNTVIAGNLYITAGVDLGNVLLENVTVLGEIVISGGGVSEGGQDSVVLRNVTSPKLVLDNVKNTEVSVHLEGDGVIDVASIRTNAFLEDNTPAGCGALRIELDGEDGRSLELAGNIKDVVNLTPKSYLSLGAGQAQSITIDETADGTTLNIVAGSEVEEVNLDVAATVTGDGDIGSLTVNADGSTVTMLPDQITIRPGVTATIDGEKMDSAAAAESSADPRMLAGYPQITDLAPTSATAQFTANKKGTLYWAITAVSDGSVSADDLINPPSYSTNIVKQSTVSISGSGKVSTAKISGLTAGGSYYLSAVFVDGREDRSTTKVISFTTPDNTAPNFATGYPYLSRVTNKAAQVTVMATKTCRLYYAVLLKGAAAPTPSDFKANSISGNFGYGSMDVTKNKTYTFDVNNVLLTELESYDLYLWLTDVDGGASSSVKKLSFTTVDGTPPEFKTEPTINSVKETSVGLYANLNEAGTLYWVVVKEGEIYPKPMANDPSSVEWTSLSAKIQVSSGMNAIKSGKVSMTEGKDVSFTVSGLDKESAYDLYYVAQDKAGNYSESIGKITIHTLDNTAPTVKQSFTKWNGEDTTKPLSDTDVVLTFSESVQDVASNVPLVDLYNEVTKAEGNTAAVTAARNKMAAVLKAAIQLYNAPLGDQATPVTEATSTTDKTEGEWVIDYRYAEITVEDSKTVITFPYGTAINLQSGARYYFEIAPKSLSDTSQSKNVMGQTKLPEFETVFAQVDLSIGSNTETAITKAVDKENQPVSLPEGGAPIDLYWRMDPVSTQKAEESKYWDMIIWSDTHVEYQLFRRIGGSDEPWQLVGSSSIMASETKPRGGNSVRMDLEDPNNNSPTFDQLKTLQEGVDYEYAVSFTEVEGDDDRTTWSQTITFDINVIAGSNTELRWLSGDISESNWDALVGTTLTNIGQPETLTLHKPFRDQTAPHFIGDRPTFTAGDSSVRMDLMLDRTGTVYWVIAKRGDISTIGTGTDTSGKNIDYSPIDKNDPTITDEEYYKYYNQLPDSGLDDGIDNDGEGDFKTPVSTPPYNWIVDAGKYLAGDNVQYDAVTCSASVKSITVEDLLPNQDYVVYFVIQGTSQVYSPVYCYRFTTGDVTPAYITMRAVNPDVEFTTSENANLSYALYASNRLPTIFTTEKLAGDNLDPQYRTNGDTPADTSITDMTLLQAIQTTIDGDTGESYFDRYASTTIKDKVRLAITSQTSSEALAQGKIDGMEQTVPESHDFTNAMNPESATSYICLATAQNELGGPWTFKAVDGVRIPDEDAPVLLKVTTSVTKKDSSSGTLKVSGSIALQFSENIYHINQEGEPDSLRAIVQTSNSTTTRVGFLDLVTELNCNLDYAGTSGIATKTIALTFKNAPLGATFSFCNTGHIADALANSRKNDSYTLELREVEGIGMITQGVKYEFVVTQGTYNGN